MKDKIFSQEAAKLVTKLQQALELTYEEAIFVVLAIDHAKTCGMYQVKYGTYSQKILSQVKT